MPVLVGPALVAAALLALAGAQKVLDPTMTVGALRGVGWPGSALVVRVAAGVELLLGVGAITAGGVVWWAVAASYAAFNVFVSTALRRGLPIGTCGCFGRSDTAPSRRHVVLNVLLGAVAVGAVTLDEAPLDYVVDRPGAGVVTVALSTLGLLAVYRAYTRGGVIR